MTRPSSQLLGAVVLTALLGIGLGGCAAPAPAASPRASDRPSASPSATADPEPASKARVVVAGDAVTVYDEDGSTTLELEYSETPSDAIGLLDDALGEQATSTVVSDDPCNPQLDESSWGGLHLWSSVEGVNKPEDAQFYVTVDAATTGDDLPIETPAGSTVGDSEADVRSANLDAPSFDDGADLHYDIVMGDASSAPDQYYGAAATMSGGKLTELRSPVYYFFEC